MKRKTRYELADALAGRYADSAMRRVADRKDDAQAVRDMHSYLRFAYLSGYQAAWGRAKADARRKV